MKACACSGLINVSDECCGISRNLNGSQSTLVVFANVANKLTVLRINSIVVSIGWSDVECCISGNVYAAALTVSLVNTTIPIIGILTELEKDYATRVYL